MMTFTVTEPLRAEHRELLPEIERLRTAADGIGAVPGETTIVALEAIHGFLTTHLVPHARAEEAVLYPAIAECLHDRRSTATMIADHGEVVRLIDELAELRTAAAERGIDSARAIGLRRVLYGLYAILKLHFAKEEDIYLPLLDASLTSEEARGLFQRMERAAVAPPG